MSGPLDNLFSDDSSLDTGSGTGQNGNGMAQGNYNPVFNEVLGQIPQDLHDKVVPVLQKWDQNANTKYQTVQQQYEPWKSVIGSGVTPDIAQAGLNLINMLETNPQALYDALRNYYKFDEQQQNNQGAPSQGQGTTEQQNQIIEDPRFAQMEQGYSTLAQHVLQMQQEKVNAQADAALEEEFAAAKSKHGEFDIEWVTAKCIANPNLTVDQGAQMYKQWYQQQAAKFGARPLIMGGGGSGVPQENVDVRKLDGKQTRSLVAQMLDQANAQNR